MELVGYEYTRIVLALDGRVVTTRQRCHVSYFMQSEHGGPIKIGRSLNVARRLRELRCRTGLPLRLLATTEVYSEFLLHERFAHLAIPRSEFNKYQPTKTTEWFRPEPELLAFIESLAA